MFYLVLPPPPEFGIPLPTPLLRPAPLSDLGIVGRKQNTTTTDAAAETSALSANVL